VRSSEAAAAATLPIQLAPRVVCAGARQRVRAAVPADQGSGAAGAAPRVLHLEDHAHRRGAGLRVGRLDRGGRFVAAAGGGRVPGGDLHPDRVPGPRRRAPAGFRLRAGQLPRRPAASQPGHRAELRLMGRQAQPLPRAPQHRRRWPRYRSQRIATWGSWPKGRERDHPAAAMLDGLAFVPAVCTVAGAGSCRGDPLRWRLG
jgi:hypothetical protein